MFDVAQASSDPRINLDYKNFPGGSAREGGFEKAILPRIYLSAFVNVGACSVLDYFCCFVERFLTVKVGCCFFVDYVGEFGVVAGNLGGVFDYVHDFVYLSLGQGGGPGVVVIDVGFCWGFLRCGFLRCGFL